MRKLASETRRTIRAVANTPLPGDFRHAIMGKRTDSLDYAAKHELSEFHLISDLISAERIQIGIDCLGTSVNTVEVKARRDKLGVAGYHVQLPVEQHAVSSAAPLQLNLKPGLGGLELINSGARMETGLEVGAVIDRQSIRRSFRLSIEDSIRLNLSSVLSQGV